MIRLLAAIAALTVSTTAATLEVVAGGGTSEPGATVREVALKEPFGVAFDNKGNWYIAEYKGHRVLRVDKKGVTSVIAGTGTAGFGGDGGPATAAQMHEPHSVLWTRNGRLIIPDVKNHAIRVVDVKTGIITSVAGTGASGFSGDGGAGSKALFNQAYAAALTPKEDKLYVCDLGNRRIRVVDLKSGVVQTIAGNGESGVPQDGADAVASPLVDPRAVAVGRKGEVYILERRGNALRVVEGGKIRTLVGPGKVKPEFNGPKDMAVAPDGAVLIVDTENHIVRRYDPKDGSVRTILGSGTRGPKLVANDPLATELNRPHGVAYGPDGALYISDSENNRVLRLKE